MTDEQYKLWQKLNAEVSEKAQEIGRVVYSDWEYVEFATDKDGSIEILFYGEDGNEHYVLMTKEMLCSIDYIHKAKLELEIEEEKRRKVVEERQASFKKQQEELEKALLQKLKNKYESKGESYE